MNLTGCCYNNQVLRELENTQLSLRHPQLCIYELNQYVSVPKMPADLQVFITCWLNESEESNVTPRSHNMGTNLIAVSLILIDLSKCSVANPFRAKSMASVLSSFICSLLWSIYVFIFEMHCSMLLIVSTIWNALLCVICIHLMKNWINSWSSNPSFATILFEHLLVLRQQDTT